MVDKGRQNKVGHMPRPNLLYTRKKFMKRVLFVTTISGFLPQFEKNDVKLLKQMGCQIHYASNFTNPIYAFDKTELEKNGVALHQIDIEKSPAKINKNIKAIKQLIKIIDENDIDIVHCHNPMGGVAARIAARAGKRKPKVIYTAHGFHFYKGAPIMNWLLFYTAERFLARYTDIIVTINREDYIRAKKFRLKKNGEVYLIHSVGVDKEKFAPRPELRETKRAELGIPADAFHIVTAAELNENKNQKAVIEAVAALTNKAKTDANAYNTNYAGNADYVSNTNCIDKTNKTHNIYYTICGKGPNEDKLRELIKAYGLENNVSLLGYRTDMDEILQTADVFAFPSIREGLGVAAIEALMCNVPLIAADNRGTREYASDGNNGIVCRYDAVDEFEEAIELLYGNTAYRKRMADRCRESVKKFTIEEVEKTMTKVYTRALGE